MHWRRYIICLLALTYAAVLPLGMAATVLLSSSDKAAAGNGNSGGNAGGGGNGGGGNGGGNSGGGETLRGGNSWSANRGGGHSGGGNSGGANAGGSSGESPGNSASGQAKGTATAPGQAKKDANGDAKDKSGSSAQTVDVSTAGAAPNNASSGGGEKRAINGEIVMSYGGSASAQELASFAAARNFRVLSDERLDTLGLSVARLAAPADMSLSAARELVANAFPGATVDYNHVYTPSSGFVLPAPDYARQEIHWQPEGNPCQAARVKIGMLDTLADLDQPILLGAEIQQKSFLDSAGSRSAMAAHGSVIATILVGQDNIGLLPESHLAIAGIFTVDQDDQPIASVSSFVTGLDWLMSLGIRTMNTSLSGPDNSLMALAVRAAIAHDVQIVAAVGNDGYRDTPRYPAAYPGVIGVTAIDANRRSFDKANRGDFVTLSAPGVDLWVPFTQPTDGNNTGLVVSGTSFATPYVVASLAASGNDAELLKATAIDLGDSGVDPTFGHGLVQATAVCRVPALQ